MGGSNQPESLIDRQAQRLRLESLPERMLVTAVISGDEQAAEVFCLRFYAPLLAASARFGLRGKNAEHLVLEVLHDFIIAIVDRKTTPPASAIPHLLYALRRRAFTARRSHVREARSLEMSVTEGGESVASGTCSESSMRESSGDQEDDLSIAPPLAHLANALIESLSDEDKLLLEWVGHRVPQRLIAKWLGQEYETVGRRIRRLVSRLVESSVALADALDATDRTALMRFFARSGLRRRNHCESELTT